MSNINQKPLTLKFPCDPKRFIDVISLCDTGGKTQQELSAMRGKTRKQVVSSLVKKGYLKLKTDEYIRYSKHWNLLIETGKEKVLIPTDLGKIFLHSWNNKQEKTAKEILYYGFVNSEKFPTFRYLVLNLAKQIRARGEFEISQKEIYNVITTEYIGLKPRDTTPLSRALYVLGFIEKQKKQYIIRPYFPSYEGFFLTLYHYYHINLTRGGNRISLKMLENSNFVNYWLMDEKVLNQYINHGHNNRIIHREKHADINQFYYISESLSELNNSIRGLNQ